MLGLINFIMRTYRHFGLKSDKNCVQKLLRSMAHHHVSVFDTPMQRCRLRCYVLEVYTFNKLVDALSLP